MAESTPQGGNTSRERIRQAALELFVQRGYAGTSVSMIAERVGLSKASLYTHMGGKSELLWEIFTNSSAEVTRIGERSIDGVACPLEQMARYVTSHVEYHATHRYEANVGNTQYKFLPDRLRKQALAFREQYEVILAQIIERGVANGIFAPTHANIAKMAILQMGTGVSSWFEQTGELSPKQVGMEYARLAARILRASQDAHRASCPDPAKCTGSTILDVDVS